MFLVSLGLALAREMLGREMHNIDVGMAMVEATQTMSMKDRDAQPLEMPEHRMAHLVVEAQAVEKDEDLETEATVGETMAVTTVRTAIVDGLEQPKVMDDAEELEGVGTTTMTTRSEAGSSPCR